MEAKPLRHLENHSKSGIRTSAAWLLSQQVDRLGRADRLCTSSTRAALIYLHARDPRYRAITDGLDTIVIVGTARLGTPLTVRTSDSATDASAQRRCCSVSVTTWTD